MASYSNSTRVNASLDNVRALLCDTGRISEWHHLIHGVRDIDTAGFAATMSIVGADIDFETLVDASNDTVTFTHVARKIEVTERITLSATEPSTEVDYAISSRGKGVFRILGKGLVPVLERSVDKGLERIAKLVEQSS